ncbi:Acetyltransferase (GNAT) domain-containing protein [Bryocella elongata]|uniref:Acetyltransferase (GNAT) domain-containing protein n=1 Tax=Bryocella elongata TaxID=863522 RepID=A0A1H5ZJP0_9BACT|nr:GNAT family N-acetyltransferase [Bryocella elongata]SEG35626.1 Acetyltransferase (GNAT) domain-containing protein [Bryocella elongata]
MELVAAEEKDFAEVVDLANIAFRKTGDGASWNVESAIAGDRLSASMLREDLSSKPGSVLLLLRDEPEGPLLGTVWLEPKSEDTWYLGLLTVRPDQQTRQLGRSILAAGEAYARERGAKVMRMTVLNVREALLAWYLRRGYSLTGETQPFPYGDDRFGTPLRDDLEFVVLSRTL